MGALQQRIQQSVEHSSTGLNITRLVFDASWTSTDVACAISSLWGPSGAEFNASDPPAEVILPSTLETVELKSDVLVTSALLLDGAGCSLVVKKNTVRVMKGGQLRLHNTTVTGSIYERAVSVMGNATIVCMHACVPMCLACLPRLPACLAHLAWPGPACLYLPLHACVQSQLRSHYCVC